MDMLQGLIKMSERKGEEERRVPDVINKPSHHNFWAVKGPFFTN